MNVNVCVDGMVIVIDLIPATPAYGVTSCTTV
jgi:hypothetical protein